MQNLVTRIYWWLVNFVKYQTIKLRKKAHMNKQRIIRILVVVLLLAGWRLFFYQNEKAKNLIHLTGTTMGPIPYSIKYLDDENRNFQLQVDSILKAFNNALSTYIPSSEISQFNQTDSVTYATPFFYPVLVASQQVYKTTNGAFDPTVGPLVNAWGFGPEKKTEMDSATVDSLLSIVGFEQIVFDENKAVKPTGMYLDFSAIAKGNGIDVVANFLADQDIENYMVEIGGEVACRGISDNGSAWRIGIQKPTMRGEPELFAKASITNRAVATSGNYRNYYEQDGKIISHTINPFTGYPATHNLLSASIFSKNCTLADGYATACMVMGFEDSKKLVEENPDLDGFFIYSDENGKLQSWISEGISKFIEIED